jgi:hypothetical protein
MSIARFFAKRYTWINDLPPDFGGHGVTALPENAL